MRTTISEFKQKYPKLISRFEKETGHKAIYHDKITKNFIYWLCQKIKYKNLICDICGRKFDSKYGLLAHKIWHRPGYREKKSKITIKLWQNPKFRESMANIRGENNPNYDKFGEEHPRWKGVDASYMSNTSG